MSIVGHGVDIVEVHRIAQMRAEHAEHFLERCFTPEEQAYCLRRARRADEHLAGRFAAKEAILKVLGTGWRGKIAWTDMEIINDATGKPQLTLTGECARVAEALCICRWHISISHTEIHAIGSAIAERNDA